jgi:hypothetical protein
MMHGLVEIHESIYEISTRFVCFYEHSRRVLIRLCNIMKYNEVLWGFWALGGVVGLTNCESYAKLP